jgi:hypothetical protein
VNEIPLATVDVASPPDRGVLQRQLADLPLPPRVIALLGDAPNEGPGPLSAGSTRGTAPFSDGATEAIRPALRTLVDRLVGGEANAAGYQGAVAQLTGLGPGLTPTGDDLLVALVAASRLFAMDGDGANGISPHGLLGRGAGDALAAAIAQLPTGLTTDVAQHLLSASVVGRFPAPLAAFVSALGDPRVDRETLAALAERLAATGAHSGADWLAGVVALARACAGGQR